MENIKLEIIIELMTRRDRHNNRKILLTLIYRSSNASSPYSCQSSRKMIDNQQQTQLYPTKITTGTSTQLNDSSWFDIIGEDPTTNDAWTRIRRRLKPQEQKDILRYNSFPKKKVTYEFLEH